MLMSNTDEGVPTGALQGPQAGNKTQPELANETFVGANDIGASKLRLCFASASLAGLCKGKSSSLRLALGGA